MLRNRIYYFLKPILPRGLRIGIRRWLLLRKRERVKDVWPILPGSEKVPSDWTGWPHDKKFAVVLTHDVEGQKGLDRIKHLAQLEMDCGFRSSYNLIPEGEYKVPAELRSWLKDNGFEIGVHDLHHDGSLYRSHESFSEQARSINQHLSEWNACGFRAGFMFHNLNWLHDLDVTYDASTFDTDPFEPQNDGAGTIFPYWVSRGQNGIQTTSRRFGAQGGYVELPYTLAQDSTVYLLMEEKSADFWLKKVDWIAKHGGMVLVNIHPDYLDFSGNGSKNNEFAANIVRDFLKTIAERYGDSYWQPLPRELAEWYVAQHATPTASAPAPAEKVTEGAL